MKSKEDKVTGLKDRIRSLEQAISMANHFLALGITGYREKKGTAEETLMENVGRATSEYARVRK